MFSVVSLVCMAFAATGVVSFKDANKIRSWDAWNDHKAQVAVTNVLQKEKECVTWRRLNGLDFGLKEIGRLPVKGVPCDKRLCASCTAEALLRRGPGQRPPEGRASGCAHGAISQSQEPAAVSAEVCGHILR